MSQIPCTGKDDCPICLLILALGLDQPQQHSGKVVHD